MNKIFKYISTLLLILALALIADFGFIQTLFDKRIIVEDAIVGADYFLIEVDDKPVERVKHGIIVSKVPLALIHPGNRKLTFCKSYDAKEELLVIETELEKGKRYRVTTINNEPALQTIEN